MTGFVIHHAEDSWQSLVDGPSRGKKASACQSERPICLEEESRATYVFCVQ